jgi:hypothetical protein
MNRSFLLIAAGLNLFVAACAAQSTPSRAAPSSGVLAEGLATITPQDLHSRISFLASDQLRGRGTPSAGLNEAAAYLVREYTRLGLEPAGEDGYYQWFSFPSIALDTATVHFGTIANGKNEMLAYGSDFFVAPVTGEPAGGRDMSHARLLWAGELRDDGLPAGDYAGAAPIVSVPGSLSREWIRTVGRARQAAQAADATALIVALGPDFQASHFDRLANASRQARRTLPAEEIPVIYLSDAATKRVVERNGQRLEQLPRSPAAPVALPGVDAHFAATAIVVEPGRAPNVAAVLRGSDPVLRDDYVVLSAHLDHVGVGAPVNGDSIFNGADDNASGTAALVEVAEALAAMPTRPARSIIFLHVSGEEHGLIGSRWFSEHPTVPLRSIVANINVDMIGRNSPDSVVVIGKDYSSLGAVVDAVAARHPEIQLVVSDDLWPEENFFFRSDHFNFARKEIPAIFFFSGVHEDYHQPSDEVAKIDTEKTARVARMILLTLWDIADTPARPTWDPEGLEEVRALTR